MVSCSAWSLVRAFGGESEDWIGKTVELHAGKIEYRGEQNDAILAKPILATDKKEGGGNEPPPWSDDDPGFDPDSFDR